jgi:hypothetical protein
MSKLLFNYSIALLATITSLAQPIADWFPKPPPLAAPTGNLVRASTAQQILTLGEQLTPDTTLLIEPGVYKLDRPLVLRAKQNITIRSANGDPISVTLQGKGWDAGNERDDIIHVANCTNVTIAALTFAEARSYGVKVEAENAPRDIHIFNCRFRNIGVRAIKGSAGNDPSIRAIGGSVRFCDFKNDKLPPANWLFNGDYISAIDMMALDKWIFSDNTFRNIKGRNGGGRAAIFIWVRSRNILIERNWILNCDRGIALGNPGASTANKPGEKLTYVANAIVQNNMITAGADCGIELWHVDGIQIRHNSIWRPERNFGRGIRIGTGTTNTIVQNNLVHGGIQLEGGGAQTITNLAKRMDGYFVDPSAGNLALTKDATEAIDRGTTTPCPYDIRDLRRTSQSDLGAWEFNALPTKDWVKPMREVHARFKGAAGTLLQVGDSITFTKAYWWPLGQKPKNITPEVEAKYDLVRSYLKFEAFNQKGPEFGNKGSMTVKWARENISTWINNRNPEVAVIMFGSNDATQLSVEAYTQTTRELLEALLANGTIPIITTPPPRADHMGRILIFANTIRKLADELHIPLIDYQNEIFERRPFDWNGARFAGDPVDNYEVPALISMDGVHPSNQQRYVNDFSERALSNNGFTLRNYLTLLTYAEVIEKILKTN